MCRSFVCFFGNLLFARSIFRQSKNAPRRLPPRKFHQKREKRSVAKMKVQVVTINSVQKSSKSELSSWGKRLLKVSLSRAEVTWPFPSPHMRKKKPREGIHRFHVTTTRDYKTLNGRLLHEDSSDFDDFWTELIVMTRSII